VPAYPIPLDLVSQEPRHFSAADFFRDSPWLNVPTHRKADILIEPLYPRLGLLGGAPESGGKVSKLAALAAARKKKEGDKAPTAAPAQPTENDKTQSSSHEQKGASLSLRERLAGNGKPQKPEGTQSPRPLGKFSRLGSHSPQKKPSPEPIKQNEESQVDLANIPKEGIEELPTNKEGKEQPTVNIRASPSTFASTIVGDVTRPKMTEPSPLYSNTLDLMKIYGQDLTEPFDFTDPSPDDVVLNAQSSAKGLAIRRKI
jgi:elongation factor 1 alpha-like protein